MSQFVRIAEPIKVAGSYLKNKSFRPSKFRWNNNTFTIAEITFVANTKDGGISKRLYSVLAHDASKIRQKTTAKNSTLFRLEFNLVTEQWQILEIWSE
jgi:hypothetical protein